MILGDVVRLKSGGIKCTVSRVYNEDRYGVLHVDLMYEAGEHINTLSQVPTSAFVAVNETVDKPAPKKRGRKKVVKDGE